MIFLRALGKLMLFAHGTLWCGADGEPLLQSLGKVVVVPTFIAYNSLAHIVVSVPPLATVCFRVMEVEYTAPELLPLWLRHGHQVPEDLTRDLQSGGELARVKLCETLDHIALGEACKKKMSGWTDAAAECLESLLCLQLKLSYLSTKIPRALKEYTNSREPGGPTRRAEIALLGRLSSEHLFPCSDNAIAVLRLLTEHLELKLAKEDPKAWEAVEQTFKQAYTWAVRTECLLVKGCDDRITVAYGAGKIANKYLSSPVPTPEVVGRSSCTSNSSSRRAFAAADKERHELLLNWALNPRQGMEAEAENQTVDAKIDGCFADRMDDVRRRLLHVLGLNHGTVEVFLTPSGSDAEFLPTVLACIRALRLGHKVNEGPAVTNIVVAAGEVGSGTAGAAGGKHFSALTPHGVAGQPGNHLAGMSCNDVIVVQMKIRTGNGALYLREEEVHSAVHKAISSSPNGVVVLHSVVGSKTGACFPSIGTMTKLKERYGERLLVVIDACQLRSQPENIRKYAANDFLTIITGSKFFCAPPFCGAVLLTTAAFMELEAGHEQVPAGLKDYFTRHEFDSQYSALRACMAEWENRGLLLRWSGALANMEAVNSIPKTKLNSFISRWVANVRDYVQDEWPYLSLVPEQRHPQSSKPLGGVNSIIPIIVRVPREVDGPVGNPEEALAYDDLRLFHRLLSEDISSLLPQDFDEVDHASGRLRVLFGQPVKLGGATFAVIRTALGADMLVDGLCSNRGDSATGFIDNGEEDDAALDHFLAQDRLSMRKCSLIARHWHQLKSFTGKGAPAVGNRSGTKVKETVDATK